jgi:uncharacterized protein (TIGR03437 family)
MLLNSRAWHPAIACLFAAYANAQTTGSTVLTTCAAISAAGNYTLAADLSCGANTLLVDAPNVSLDCGGFAIRVSYPASVHVEPAASNFTLAHCAVDSGGATGPGPFPYFSLEVGAPNFEASSCSLENVFLYQAQGATLTNNVLKGGFQISGCSGMKLQGNTVHSAGPFQGVGIWVLGGGNTNAFTGNFINGAGIWLDNEDLGGSASVGEANNDLIQENLIQNGDISVTGPLTNAVIDGNTVANGILVYSGDSGDNPQWSGVVVSNNFVRNATQMFVLDSYVKTGPTTFSGNRFVNNTFADAVPFTPAAFDFAACADFTFTTCSGIGGTGSAAVPGVENNLIQGNNFGLTTRPPLLLPVQAFTDGGGNICSASTAVLNCSQSVATVTITTSSLANGTVGTPYSQTLTATGGVPPFNNWVLSSGAMPAGLTLNASNGTISGVPTAAAGSPLNFSVIVMDAAGTASAPQNLSIAVSRPSALTVVTASPLAPGTVGVSYTGSFAATSGTAPYRSWSISAGALPPGTSLTSNSSRAAALLSGTPTIPGVYTFTVQVADSVSAVASKQFSLTINPAGTPSIAAIGIVNAASYAGGGVAPGEIVTIFGSGIGPNTLASLQLTSSGAVATTLGGVQVLFDGTPAPLVYAQSTQISAVVPYEVGAELLTEVQVVYQGQGSGTVLVPVTASAPGIFSLDASGSGAGAILNQDSTINSAGNPAAAGSIIVLYATGEGQTNPPGVDGKLGTVPLPAPAQSVTATVGGVSAEVLYAGGYVGGVAGVIQVNLQLPPGVTGGAVPVTLNVGGANGQAGITVAIQ